MFRGLIDGGPLGDCQRPPEFFVMAQPDRLVTCISGPKGLRVLSGARHGEPGEVAVEYEWVCGVWLWGEQLALARIARDAGV